jgi:hypothetical protein
MEQPERNIASPAAQIALLQRDRERLRRIRQRLEGTGEVIECGLAAFKETWELRKRLDGA